MASRTSLFSRRLGNAVATSSGNVCLRQRNVAVRAMASVAPPVTQDSVGSQGPTAMVFMNMGGPSTTGEVGDFLSRLFVRNLEFQNLFPDIKTFPLTPFLYRRTQI